MSRKNGCQTRPTSTLRHKVKFAYECLLTRGITWRCMHVHAVLSSYEYSKLAATKERMIRWLHRLDG
jgi:hypothetical protein